MLSFQQLIYKSARLISDTGILSVIIPCDDAENFITIAEDNNLHLIRKIDIYGIKGGKLKKYSGVFQKIIRIGFGRTCSGKEKNLFG